MAGLDNGINYAFDEEEKTVVRRLPYNPLKDEELYKESVEKLGNTVFAYRRRANRRTITGRLCPYGHIS